MLSIPLLNALCAGLMHSATWMDVECIADCSSLASTPGEPFFQAKSAQGRHSTSSINYLSEEAALVATF